MELRLDESTTPFSLDYTLSCGQTFRWEKMDDWWYGVVDRNVVKIRQRDDKLLFYTFPEEGDVEFIESYFRLDDDLPYILSQINKDVEIEKAIQRFYGLRIVRQDPWECLISYICATNANIHLIKNMILNMARGLGRRIDFEGRRFYTFPEPVALARASLNELRRCKSGYRAKYVLETSRRILDGELQLDSLRKLGYEGARKRLASLPGVGPKVADCVLLFSLGKLEAFPVDIWVKRIILELYGTRFPGAEASGKKTPTPGEYERISSFGRRYFGRYAGYAQEYLFYYGRTRQ